MLFFFFFFFSSRRRHTRWPRDWSSDVCSSDLQHGGTVVGRHPGWHLDSETEEKLAAVGCPRDRHRDVSHRVFEDQIPPDDPGYKLPQCGVAVGVRRTGDRDQAGELRIAETAETASHGGQENRDRNPGPRRRETASSRGSRSQRREYSGADDGADAERNQVDRGQCLLEAPRLIASFSYQNVQRLPSE